MICPVDRKEMSPIRLPAHYAGMVEVDQCPVCGGLWFDSNELYMIKQGEAEKVDFKKELFLKRSEFPDFILCPRDRMKMVRCLDPHLVKEINMEYCQKCTGLWLDCGEFVQFQNLREKKKSQKSRSIPPELNDLFASQTNLGGLGILGGIAEVLNTDLRAKPAVSAESEATANEITGVIMNTINIAFFILRLLLKV
jgi:Zn-finger nucleic acid-binding protein